MKQFPSQLFIWDNVYRQITSQVKSEIRDFIFLNTRSMNTQFEDMRILIENTIEETMANGEN